MTYEEIVAKVRTIYEKTDVSQVKEHLAIQFNVTGEGEGAFYVEVADGQMKVEPYDYVDRDVLVTATAAELFKVMQGEIGLVAAYTTGRIKAEGNLGKILQYKDLISPEKKKEEKKTVEKAVKAPAKKHAATTKKAETEEAYEEYEQLSFLKKGKKKK